MRRLNAALLVPQWTQMVYFLTSDAVHVMSDPEPDVGPEPEPEAEPDAPLERVDRRSVPIPVGVRAEVVRVYRAHMVGRRKEGYQKAERGFVEGLIAKHRVSRSWIEAVIRDANGGAKY